MKLIALMTFVLHSPLWAAHGPSLHTHKATSTEQQSDCDDLSRKIDTRFGNVDFSLWQNLLEDLRGKHPVEFFFDNWSEETFVLTETYCTQTGEFGQSMLSARFETSSVGSGSIIVLLGDIEVQVVSFILHDLLAPIE